MRIKIKHLNVKLLSTSIMIVFGVDGHGKCLTQSIIASKVLQKLGHDAKIVGGYHVCMYQSKDQDYLICHAPWQTPRQHEKLTTVVDMTTENNTWMHCWVEVKNKIIDVNLHHISDKKYTDINYWDIEQVRRGKEYYMPTDYNLAEIVDERKIDMVIKTYHQLKSILPCKVNVQEGLIQIKDDGSWVPLYGYQMNKNILPHTKVFAKNPELLV